MTKERYSALKDWLIKTALQFYSMNGIFKSAEEKEEWYKLYQKEDKEDVENKKVKKQEKKA